MKLFRNQAATVVVVLSVSITCSVHAGGGAESDPTIGLILHEEGVAPGYVLFAPHGSVWTKLLDNDGNVVHEWTDTLVNGNTIYLLEDGSLLRCVDPGPAKGSVLIAGGDGGAVRRWDWDGNLIWDFEYNTPAGRLHHDIEPMPNGNVLMIAWEYKSAEEAIAAGRDPLNIDTEGENSVWPLHIIEVEPDGLNGGNIVWEWRLWDHLVQDFDSTKDNFGVIADNPRKVDLNYVRDNRGDWIHANSIDYNPELDQILISTPFLSEHWIINHALTTEEAAGEAGDLLYRWGNPEVYGRGTAEDQRSYFNHDARWVESGLPGEGNILFFNNRAGERFGATYSTVDEFTPAMNEDGTYDIPETGPFGPTDGTVVFQADPPESFYSSGLSGAERQPNGNTIICKGRGGVFYEITPVEDGGEIVWHYVNPVTSTGPLRQGCPPSGQNSFRASRFSPDYSGFDGRTLDPMGPLERPRCVGDFDCTGLIDGADLTALLGNWGTAGPDGDMDGDGLVDGVDLAELLGRWGLCD